MEVIKDIKLLKEKIEQLSKLGGKTIGLIHTRGPLHEGHRTLIQAARKEKNFALADEIRNKLTDMGIVLEDTRQGVKWSKM